MNRLTRLSANPTEAREIHVWIVELSAPAAPLEACAASLSPDEMERADRFRFEHLRTAFILARGCLRMLLGRYTRVPPDRLRFAYGMHGKPRLAFPDAGLEFNASHSGRFAAYAFAAGCEVGVDLEEMRPTGDREDIVRRFFSLAECEEWLALDPSQRKDAFYRYWTGKEAYIKARGGGLSIPLDGFRVILPPGGGRGSVSAAGNPAAAETWLLCGLAPADGYVGAVAAPEREREIRLFSPWTAPAVVELASGPGGISDDMNRLGRFNCPSIPGSDRCASSFRKSGPPAVRLMDRMTGFRRSGEDRPPPGLTVKESGANARE